jgi:hypothetical protein
MAEIEPFRSGEPDYTRCRALVLSGPHQGRQCSRRPVETRQGRDGKLYRVCRAHKRAKSFWPWTPWSPMDELEARSRFNRLVQEIMEPVLKVVPFKRP